MNTDKFQHINGHTIFKFFNRKRVHTGWYMCNDCKKQTSPDNFVEFTCEPLLPKSVREFLKV